MVRNCVYAQKKMNMWFTYIPTCSKGFVRHNGDVADSSLEENLGCRRFRELSLWLAVLSDPVGGNIIIPEITR